MKVSIALGVIQSALIIYLVVAINDLSNSNRQVIDEQPVVDPSPQYAITPTSRPANFNEALLRQIIREELNLLVSAQAFADSSQNIIPVPRIRVARQYSTDEIELSIDQLKGIGRVSPAEMHALEAKIVTLDKAERMQMMGKLMAAMNAGEIKGRFQ